MRQSAERDGCRRRGRYRAAHGPTGMLEVRQKLALQPRLSHTGFTGEDDAAGLPEHVEDEA